MNGDHVLSSLAHIHREILTCVCDPHLPDSNCRWPGEGCEEREVILDDGITGIDVMGIGLRGDGVEGWRDV